jgi:hypothetical protein
VPEASSSGVEVQGPDGNTYQFPAGTDKAAAIRYFRSKGIGAKKTFNIPPAPLLSTDPPPTTGPKPGFGTRYMEQMIGTQHPIEAVKSAGKYLKSRPFMGIMRDLRDAGVDLGKAAYDQPWQTAKTVGGSLVGAQQLEEDWKRGNIQGILGTLSADLTPMALSRLSKILKAIRAGASVSEAIKGSKTALEMTELGGKFPVTTGQLKGGTAAAAEAGLRKVPLAKGPLEAVTRTQEKFVTKFAETLPGKAAATKTEADAIYNQIRGLSDEMDGALKARHQFSEAAFKVRKDPYRYREAAEKVAEQDEFIKGRLRAHPQYAKLADDYDRARDLWAKHYAMRDVHETLLDHLAGLPEQAQTLGQARKPLELKAETLTEELKRMNRYGTLNRALGEKGASQLMQASELISRAQRKGMWPYIIDRIAGMAIIGIGTAGAVTHPGYIPEIAAGMAGGRIMASALANPGGARAVISLLKAGASPQAMALYGPRIVRAAGETVEEEKEERKGESNPPVQP